MRKARITGETTKQLRLCEQAIKQIQIDLKSKTKEQIEAEIEMTKMFLDQVVKILDVQCLDVEFEYKYSLN